MGPTRSCPSIYSRPRDTSAAKETVPEPSERRTRSRGTSAAEETVPEASERRRPRGRPRRAPLTDHERGSLRSSRDDDVPQDTVGEEAVPQMYDDIPQDMVGEEAVPHASEEAVPHTSEEGAGGLTSSASSKPYLRGPAKLPKRPIPVDRRPLIAPEGER
jgi:hypothetical protein